MSESKSESKSVRLPNALADRVNGIKPMARRVTWVEACFDLVPLPPAEVDAEAEVSARAGVARPESLVETPAAGVETKMKVALPELSPELSPGSIVEPGEGSGSGWIRRSLSLPIPLADCLDQLAEQGLLALYAAEFYDRDALLAFDDLTDSFDHHLSALKKINDGVLPSTVTLYSEQQVLLQKLTKFTEALKLPKSVDVTPAVTQSAQSSTKAENQGAASPPTRDLRKRAEGGDLKAQIELGHAYAVGEGIPRDDGEAAKWYRKAAEQGDVDSQYYVGFLHRDAIGVSQDYAEAARWFLKASEAGNAEAQADLGNLYAQGKGVQRNLVEAYAWATAASTAGLERGKSLTALVGELMTSEQKTAGAQLGKDRFERFSGRRTNNSK